MRWFFAVMLLVQPAFADTVIATRTIRAQTLIEPGDVALVAAEVPGALTDTALAIGQEARVVLYAGRPIRGGDLGPAAVIERNQTVTLQYSVGGLAIATEGRALGRGGPGDVIRVMNLASRSTVSGRVQPDGTVAVGPS